MAEKRKRGQNFTTEEKDKLVKLLCAHKDTILNKKTDGTTNDAKTSAWIELTNSFNSCATVYRSKDSLMKVWEKMKTESKLYYQASKSSIIKTGGGSSEVKVDPILEQVCALLGRACTGIIGVQDSDSSERPPPIKKVAGSNISVFNDEVTFDFNEFDVTYEVENNIEETPSTSANATEHDYSSKHQEITTPKTPLWSRRRPQISNTNERTEAVSSLCSSFTNVNKKKEDIEEIKRKILQEELEFKRKLYDLQLQTATKELEIKTEVLNQIKGGAINLQNLFGGQQKD